MLWLWLLLAFFAGICFGIMMIALVSANRE